MNILVYIGCFLLFVFINSLLLSAIKRTDIRNDDTFIFGMIFGIVSMIAFYFLADWLLV